MTKEFDKFVSKIMVECSKFIFEKYSIIEEKLLLKRKVLDDGSMIFVVDSDLLGGAASNETFRNKDKIRETGLFHFDKTNLRKWVSKKYSPEEFQSNIPLFRKAIHDLNNTTESFDELADDLEELLEAGMQDKIAGFIDDLKNKITNDSNSPEFKEFFAFRQKFRRYSFNNQILIFLQKKGAKHVAGKMKWLKEFNRKIKLGAKGIYIYVPIMAKNQEGEASMASGGEDEVRYNTRFILKPVFDISDTEVIEGKEDKAIMPEEPKWFNSTEIDEKTEIIYNALEDYAKTHNIAVSVGSEGLGTARGVSKIGSIQLAEKNISTLTHEIAHEILHKLEDRMKVDSKILELQAEGVAYIVLREFDLDVTHVSNYMVLWKIDAENIKEHENLISKTATEIIDFIYEFGSKTV